jgi:phenylacetate-coenzyme A ligase PaaK-like adenylate-forming protein
MLDAKAYIGSSLMVELCDEGAIERSQGKAKRVLDLRKA